MKKKKTTIAEEHKKIYDKFYTKANREPGDDSFTDEAYNMAAKRLMTYQESIKPKEEPQQQQQQQQPQGMQPQGTQMQDPQQMVQRKYGGDLPKYEFGTDSFGLEDPIEYDPSEMNAFQLGERLNAGGGYSPNLQSNEYTPKANPLMPLIGIGTNIVSNAILKKNSAEREEGLLSKVGVDLGRVNAQKIDLGRERANIKANQAQTEASGRYAARGAKSASEASRISNAARLSGQRISGNLLSKSFNQEEQSNQQSRTAANNQNLNLSNQEKLMEAKQRMDIEQRYGGVETQLDANLAKSTGQSVMNYLGENQQMKKDYNFLQMSQPDLTMDYQDQFNKLTPFQQQLRRMGIGEVSPTIKARNYGKK